MKRVAWLAASAAFGLLTISVSAQTADFSGRWTSEPQATGPARGRQAGTQRGAPGQRGARGQRGGRGQRGAGQRGRGRRTGDMGSGWGSNLTVTQDEKQLTVEYAFFVRGDLQPPLKFAYSLDGFETKNSVMMGRGIQVQTSKTGWEAEKLVISTLHTFTHPTTGEPMTVEVKQALSLETPESLIVEATRSGVLGGPPSTTRTVYRRN